VRPEREGARRPRPSPVARRTFRRAAPLCALAILAGAASVAPASDTQWWITTQASDLARAESRGVVIDPNGVMRLGPRLASFPAESLGVIWALAPLGDGSIALAGDGGRIDRWTASGGVRRWIHLPVGQVLALARDGDGLVAGTAPGGAIYHVGARGDTALMVNTGERYVWGIAAGPRGIWYAATGTRGRLMKIEGGHARIVLDTDESNLVSILADGHGGVYAGGDSKGRVVHVSESGSARTAFDATEEEVRALALGGDGALYAAAMSISAAPTAASAGITVTPAGAAASGDSGDDDADRSLVATVVAGGGHATVYRIVPDSSATSWWVAPQPAIFALEWQAGALLAATGNRAAIYRVTDLNLAGPLFLAPQGQVTALARVGDAVFAATSNPGVLWRLGPEAAQRGDLLSGTFDAHRMARFGHLVWHGSGSRVGLSTRTGNTDPPDTTWSPWTGGEVGSEGAKIESPAGRYLQWKLSLDRADERVDAVEASWREVNQPPRIESITIAPQGSTFREGELQPRSEPVTQTLPGGQKVEYSIGSAATPRALRSLPTWARGLRTVQWRATDPDGDVLKYMVEERSEGATNWIKIVDQLESPAFTWDTNPLPDGRYRLRVTATDATSNAVGEERVVRVESAPFTIDNTPPRIARLEAAAVRGGVRIEGEASDESGRLSQLDVATDEGDWRPLTPDGGLTDTPRATFHATLSGLAPGEHTVSVRATDLAGNAVARAVRVTVPAER
jgi:hypothetical protein